MKYIFCLTILLFIFHPSAAQEPDIDIINFGIGLPSRTCNDFPPFNFCLSLDGNQNLTIEPGMDFIVMLRYRNDGVTDWDFVNFLDQDNRALLSQRSNTVFPGDTILTVATLRAPKEEGEYAYLLTATATNFVGRSGTAQARFFLNVEALLPVELSAFSGHLLPKNRVELRWRTESEVGHDRFEVERSEDGKQFSYLGAHAGANEGATEGQRSYRFADNYPLPTTNYYRLHQIDLDGTETLSPIIAVNVPQEDDLSVYPNPFTTELTIRGTHDEPTELLDLNGRKLFDLNSSQVNTKALGLLPPGPYLLRSGAEKLLVIKN